ncbi:MAG: hypothetical protein U0529_08990 [Thermoanaerobaculia bacterium]
MDDPKESPQAAVVGAHLAALRAGDAVALRATCSARLVEQVDDPGFAARLEVMGHLVPETYSVTALVEDGERASLEVETDRQTGRFELVRESDGWKVTGQLWKAKESAEPS